MYRMARLKEFKVAEAFYGSVCLSVGEIWERGLKDDAGKVEMDVDRWGNKRDGGKKGEIMSSPILPGNGHVLRSIA